MLARQLATLMCALKKKHKRKGVSACVFYISEQSKRQINHCWGHMRAAKFTYIITISLLLRRRNSWRCALTLTQFLLPFFACVLLTSLSSSKFAAFLAFFLKMSRCSNGGKGLHTKPKPNSQNWICFFPSSRSIKVRDQQWDMSH